MQQLRTTWRKERDIEKGRQKHSAVKGQHVVKMKRLFHARLLQEAAAA
jgi:hypothetical protein